MAGAMVDDTHRGHAGHGAGALRHTEDHANEVGQEHGGDDRDGIGAQQAHDGVADAGSGDDRGERAACASDQQHHAGTLQGFTSRLLQILAADVRQAHQVSAQSTQGHGNQFVAQEAADQRLLVKHSGAQSAEQDVHTTGITTGSSAMPKEGRALELF